MQLSDLKQDMEVFQTFADFTEAHEGIAAFRIKHLRQSVIENRVFLTEIADMYSLVKSYYFAAKEQSIDAATGKKAPQKKSLFSLFSRGSKTEIGKNTSFLKKNGKNLSLLLSSNTGFYGGVMNNLFDNFITYIANNPSDVALVGKTGRELFHQYQKSHPNNPNPVFRNEPKYFDMDDDNPGQEDMNKIVVFMRDYDNIILHHIQFFSVLTQIPYYTNISGEATRVEGKIETQPYSFEPSYEEILMFFETQILEAIFRQKVYEHQLARYGGKLVAMDDAVTSSKEAAQKLNKRSIRLRKQILNKKQQEVFSAIFGGYIDY